jgi:hypothetical protein
MATFLVLTPPDTASRDENARFLRDRFSCFAFFLPVIWLLTQRVWFAAALAFAVQALGMAIAGNPQFGLLGPGLVVAVGLLVALEGPALVLAGLTRKRWTLDTVISAADRETAEEIYYFETPAAGAASPERARPALPASETSARRHGPMLGLVGFEEGR